MSADTSKMEEVINKPDDQFEDTLRSIVNYKTDTKEKQELMNEIYQNETSAHHHIKPTSSMNSSTYSSAASSSSSSSSSSTNSASSTSSTLSSPSQSNLAAPKSSIDQDKDNPIESDDYKFELAILEDLGRTAKYFENRAVPNQNVINTINLHKPTHVYDSSAQNKTAVDNNKTRSTTSNLTNTKTNGPRKKKPVEQPVLSQHIPGHKGGEDVESLLKFIQSGAEQQTNNSKKSSSNSNTTNKRAKSQPKKSNQTDNERDIQQSRKASNVTNGDNSNVASSKSAPCNDQKAAQTIQQKPVQSSQPPAQAPANQRKSQPPTVNINQKQASPQEPMNNSVNNKPSRASRGYNKEPQQSNSATSTKSVKCATNKQSNDERDESHQSQKEHHNVVTFADHIKISDDDDTAQYTFGFFDEQKPKLMKASLKSDQRRYVFNDKIDANSFNYKQMVEFMSKSWNQTMALNMTKTTS